MEKNRLNLGDTIKCIDADDAIKTMAALEEEGYETDFLYEKDGEKGLWLEVVSWTTNTCPDREITVRLKKQTGSRKAIKAMTLVTERANALVNVLIELEDTGLDCQPQLKAFIKTNIDDMAKCLTGLSEEFTE